MDVVLVRDEGHVERKVETEVVVLSDEDNTDVVVLMDEEAAEEDVVVLDEDDSEPSAHAAVGMGEEQPEPAMLQQHAKDAVLWLRMTRLASDGHTVTQAKPLLRDSAEGLVFLVEAADVEALKRGWDAMRWELWRADQMLAATQWQPGCDAAAALAGNHLPLLARINTAEQYRMTAQRWEHLDLTRANTAVARSPVAHNDSVPRRLHGAGGVQEESRAARSMEAEKDAVGRGLPLRLLASGVAPVGERAALPADALPVHRICFWVPRHRCVLVAPQLGTLAAPASRHTHALTHTRAWAADAHGAPRCPLCACRLPPLSKAVHHFAERHPWFSVTAHVGDPCRRPARAQRRAQTLSCGAQADGELQVVTPHLKHDAVDASSIHGTQVQLAAGFGPSAWAWATGWRAAELADGTAVLLPSPEHARRRGSTVGATQPTKRLPLEESRVCWNCSGSLTQAPPPQRYLPSPPLRPWLPYARWPRIARD
jgi:hypothetical protein